MSFERALWSVVARDLRIALAAKETLIWLFVMPIVFFYFIGTVAGGGTQSDEPDVFALESSGDGGFLAEELERRLVAAGYTVVHSARGVRHPDAAAELTLPERFSERVLAGERFELPLRVQGEGRRESFHQVKALRAAYSVLADLVVVAGQRGEPSSAAFAALGALPRSLQVRAEAAGKLQRIPQGFEQAIPGTLVMFTLIVLLTSGSIGLVLEREQGLLRRLAAAPLSRGEIVFAKWASRVALGWVQVGFAMLAGTLLFDMDWGPDLAMVLVLLAAWAALVASLSILLCSLARTIGQTVAIGVLASNVLAALGGCWWPIEIVPRWMQQLALCLPTGWTMDGLHQVVLFGNGAASAAGHLAALLAGALVFGWIAAKRFRFQ